MDHVRIDPGLLNNVNRDTSSGSRSVSVNGIPSLSDMSAAGIGLQTEFPASIMPSEVSASARPSGFAD